MTPDKQERLRALIEREWQNLLDKDDRTSPEEYPDMALITFEEFADAMTALDAASRSIPAGKDAELVRELEEASMELQRTAWGRLDGGLECCLSAVLADKAAARLSVQSARIAELEARLEKAEVDSARLDFLDDLNRRLNAHYGTKYRWEMVINHNVNRLMLKFPYGVDLNDAKAHGFNSCRDVLDREMNRIAAGRAARRWIEGGE